MRDKSGAVKRIYIVLIISASSLFVPSNTINAATYHLDFSPSDLSNAFLAKLAASKSETALFVIVGFYIWQLTGISIRRAKQFAVKN